MKSIAFIIPWIGKFPNYFELWLESCRFNPSIDFLVFTNDHTEYNYPKNVIIHYMSFENMKSLFQKKYDFPLKIDAPYKFCDFRPAFGEIFAKYLTKYDYWGHCDIDLIWGNIRKFITDDILTNYKRVFSRGHCSIYENSLEVNGWYKNLKTYGCQNYKDVFQSNKSCCYDEWAGHCGGGISQIIKLNNIDMYDEVCTADINVNYGRFKINRMNDNYKSIYFSYNNGILNLESNTIKKEVLCVHFQKRKLIISNDLNYKNFYFLAPNYITSNAEEIHKNIIQEKKFEINKLIIRIHNKLKKSI